MRRIALIAAAGTLGLALALLGWIWAAPCWMGGCAPVDQLTRFSAEGSELLDTHGEPFGILATVNRRTVPLDSVPEHLPLAFLAIEDRRFYQHGGLDWRRTAGALVANVRRGGVAEGGSTISQQLARNLFPDDLPYTERSLRRKILEARVARQIERAMPKEKILELYMNQIYLGAGAYGVEAASQAYFGKPAADLTLAEAALIGGLPRAPSQINPRASREKALERRNLVLKEMAGAGYITADEAEEARETPIRLSRPQPDEKMQGSYFTERVRLELEEIIGDRFYTAGLRIHTTLDRAIQTAAEEELAGQLDALEAGQFGAWRHGRYERGAEFDDDAGDTQYAQGAVVVMDVRTGAVHALVGGRDYEDSKFDRAWLAERQVGSAFKPYIYLAALERYRSPVHTVEDTPVRVTLSGGRVWSPRNFNDAYSGTITIREALARSKNAATVRLAQDLGIGTAVRTARQLGINGEMTEFPSTALGAASLKPIEVVTSYAAFSNGGEVVKPHFVKRIEDRDGYVLWEAAPQRTRAVDPEVAFVLTSMLRDVVDRGTGTAVRAAGFTGPAAGKTGTTNGSSDVWFVGYTPDLVAGVWIGLDRPRTIVPGASGGTIAAPVWGRIMRRTYQGRPMPGEWQRPGGVVTEEVDRATGSVVADGCPPRGAVYTEYFVRVRPPVRPCPGEYDPRYGYGDTLGDEEWDLRAEGEVAPGIIWPELDSLRRAREAEERLPVRPDDRTPLGTPRPRDERPDAGARAPRDTSPVGAEPDRLPTRRPSEEPSEEPRERPPPRLLGDPVQRPDTAGGGSR
jgi:penicillin-binding protein 1A